MRTTRDAGGPGARLGWWRKVGALGVALVLPGGLVLLLCLLARSQGASGLDRVFVFSSGDRL